MFQVIEVRETKGGSQHYLADT